MNTDREACTFREYQEQYGHTPVTELHNSLSVGLDGAMEPMQFMRILRAVDAQLFSGWSPLFDSCLDPTILRRCDALAQQMGALLQMSDKGKSVAIALSGCGTSGRMAYLLTVHLNKLLLAQGKIPIFHYLISGGDSAVLFSDELPEDDPTVGAEDIKRVISSAGRDAIMLIGITCGLSAPYVAGQLDYLMQLKKSDPAVSTHVRPQHIGVGVMGFNPVFLSRNAPIEKFEDKKSFLIVLRDLESLCNSGDKNCVILNPVVSNGVC